MLTEKIKKKLESTKQEIATAKKDLAAMDAELIKVDNDHFKLGWKYQTAEKKDPDLYKEWRSAAEKLNDLRHKSFDLKEIINNGEILVECFTLDVDTIKKDL